MTRSDCAGILNVVGLCLYEREDVEEARVVVQINYDEGLIEHEVIERFVED